MTVRAIYIAVIGILLGLFGQKVGDPLILFLLGAIGLGVLLYDRASPSSLP